MENDKRWRTKEIQKRERGRPVPVISSRAEVMCAALSIIFSRNSSINKLSQSVPTALCVCVSGDVWACFCVFVILCLFSLPLCFGFRMWVSVCICGVCITARVADMPLTQKHASPCECWGLCVQVATRPHCNHIVWGVFFHQDNMCSDNKSSS